MFLKLSFLNMVWISVIKFFNLFYLECLNMSNCIIDFMFKGFGVKVFLSKFIVFGVTFFNEIEDLGFVVMDVLYYLDFSNVFFYSFCFLFCMKVVEYLDFSFIIMGDSSVELIALVGENLKYLNFSCMVVSFFGIGSLVGKVFNLEILLFFYIMVDDVVLLYMNMMFFLKCIDLSEMDIKGIFLF